MAKWFNTETDGEAILNILHELDDNDSLAHEISQFDAMELVLTPPNDGQDSDQDDAPSDVEGDLATVRHIGKGVLTQPIQVRGVHSRYSLRPTKQTIQIEQTASDESDNDTAGTYAPEGHHIDSDDEDCNVRVPKKKRKTTGSQMSGKNRATKSKSTAVPQRNWDEVSLDANKKLPPTVAGVPHLVDQIMANVENPIDMFREIFSDDILEILCYQTELYASQKNANLKVTKEDMMIFLAILLYSGYAKYPSRDCYWEQRPDTQSAFVRNAMSRNRFREIFRYFHLNDNLQDQKLEQVFKTRPLLDFMNAKFLDIIKVVSGPFSIDEAMEPYYGRHFMKQFIRGKPIRYGFKFWCLNFPCGYLAKFEPYTGAKNSEKTTVPLGTRVVQTLSTNVVPPESTLYIDNFFISLPLIDHMTEKGINIVGTIRADRVQNAPLKELKKAVRGSFHAVQETSSKTLLVRWHDNSQVTVASNVCHEGAKGLTTCKRWSRSEHKDISVPMPTLVSEYNKNMGGVDLFDKQRGLYRIRIRSKKWYWPLVRFIINGAVVNAWILFRNIDKDMPLLEFTRRIVIAILTVPPISNTRGPVALVPKKSSSVLNEVRLDGKGPLVDGRDNQRKCAVCKKNSVFICIKCDVGLHPRDCFLNFHRA